jgi:hypothetical protein
MALHVFVFLLVVCVLLTLARFGRLEWFQLRPSSSQDEAKCSRFPRLLKPRSPDDCPACCLASPPSSAEVPVHPWASMDELSGSRPFAVRLAAPRSQPDATPLCIA